MTAITRLLAALAALSAAADALGISSKLDLPGSSSIGIVRSHRPLGTDALNPEVVQAVLNVKVVPKSSKTSHPEQGTSVNAIVCINSEGPNCAKQPSLRPSTDLSSEEEEPVLTRHRHNDEEEEEPVRTRHRHNDESEEEEEEVSNKKPNIVYVDDDVTHDEKNCKKKKKNKVPDVPVFVGYAGANIEEESNLHNKVHIPVNNGFVVDQSQGDVPFYTGLKLSPEFGKSKGGIRYIHQPQKEISVTYKQVPFGFDESALVTHIFETSPLIRALHTTYNPSIHQNGHDTRFGVSSFNNRHRVHDIPDYVAGLEKSYHPVPGFYGGVQPGVYPHPGGNRGIVRPGGRGCQYPSPGVWSPSPSIPTIQDKVAFDGDEEEIKYNTGTRVDTDSGNVPDAPVVIKIDGKLGGPLEGLKT